MKRTLARICNAALLSAALMAPLALTPTSLLAQDHSYHDKKHNDDHQWNDREDKAYRIWAEKNHHKNVGFEKLKERDQQNYWAWRHSHSDALLKIDIR